MTSWFGAVVSPVPGGRSLPIITPMYDKFVGGMPAGGLWNVVCPVRVHNVKTGCPAIGVRLHIGTVARSNTE